MLHPQKIKVRILNNSLKPGDNRIWATKDRETARKQAREYLSNEKDKTVFCLLEIPLKEPYTLVPERREYPSEIAIDTNEKISTDEIIFIEEFTVQLILYTIIL